MAYNIDQVNADSTEGQRQEAIRQANSAVDVIAKTEAVVEVQKRENAGQEVEARRDMARYEADVLKEETSIAEDSAEATVATEVASAGMPAAVQLASMGAQMFSGVRSNPGHMDPKKLSKMTGGTVTSAGTMEDMASSMLGSFVGEPESKGSELLARSNAQSAFTAGSKTTGMAVPPDAINVKFVKDLTQDLGQKAYYEQTLANANRPAARPQMPGLGHNGYKDGPKFREPTDREVKDDTTVWA